MNEKYELIGKFVCNGVAMVTIRLGNSASVMSEDDYTLILNDENKYIKRTKVA